MTPPPRLLFRTRGQSPEHHLHVHHCCLCSPPWPQGGFFFLSSQPGAPAATPRSHHWVPTGQGSASSWGALSGDSAALLGAGSGWGEAGAAWPWPSFTWLILGSLDLGSPSKALGKESSCETNPAQRAPSLSCSAAWPGGCSFPTLLSPLVWRGGVGWQSAWLDLVLLLGRQMASILSWLYRQQQEGLSCAVESPELLLCVGTSRGRGFKRFPFFSLASSHLSLSS